ncbi:hypothetical protein GALMADRAFT_138793 [Galerina marginata CBS 339.88]|uniref:Uncharacterized protein n=1 Tax=Galerina marginata (strain CBS 339.88) TaxID=685588 RepID=A0A067TCV3_GALM3|nr:hypothetical protein GALMADRAFT_138793 [Galerina marginata CBS 339.88]
MSVPLIPGMPQPWHGPFRKLAIVIDIGETTSGISYCFLVPGQVPKFEVVHGSECDRCAEYENGGDSRIPNTIYYDRSGIRRAVGGTTSEPRVMARAKEEGWVMADSFKLLLIPGIHWLSSDKPDFLPLPLGKSLTAILADFFRYLFDTTVDYLRNSASKADLDHVLRHESIEFVLAHPSSYKIEQRRIIHAGVVQSVRTWAAEARRRVEQCGTASHTMARGKQRFGSSLDRVRLHTDKLCY